MENVNFKELAPKIGIHLLGKPTSTNDKEIRWGTHGSWCLNLSSGTFYSFELKQGGGVIWLIEHFNQDKKSLLNMFGGNMEQQNKQYKKFTNTQMRMLVDDSIVYLRYTDSFVVMRFPENHYIKQKYAPFTKINNEWYLRRPEGLLPLYYKEEKGPVIITEGEKALLALNTVYKDSTCTWHGGVNAWDKTDWSPIYGQEVIIWPDNDTPGKECSKQIAKHLTENGCKVSIVKIPSTFKDKDDLYDALIRKEINKSNFKNYLVLREYKERKSSITLKPIKDIMGEIKEPEWLIEDIIEKESVIDIYGAPKSGKSFISIDMALCISMGIPWYKHKSTQTPVVYLAGEGQRGIARRVQAWKQNYDNNLYGSQLFVSDRGVRFLDDKDHNSLIDHIYTLEEQFNDIGCIFVDTLARNFGGGNENSTEDMNKFIEKVDILKQEFNCCIALIHHTGHNSTGRARGSSVLPAAVDSEFAVKRKKDSEKMQLEFTQTLIKDGKPMKDKYFEFKEIELFGFNGLTSGVLIEVEKEMLYQEDNKIDETILTIKELQERFAKEQETDPINIWVAQKDIIAASDIKDSAVKQRLKRLKDADKIYYELGKGYQTKFFDSIE